MSGRCATYPLTRSTHGRIAQFKTFVYTRVSHTVELIAPEYWNHISSKENPADCASTGLYPTELLQHHLWWNGPEWLASKSSACFSQPKALKWKGSGEEEMSLFTVVERTPTACIPVHQYSSYSHLKHVTS